MPKHFIPNQETWFNDVRGRSSTFLLSEPEFQLVLAKERMRCDRHLICFGLIVFKLDVTGDQYNTLVSKFEKILHHRLRLTDEKGFWSNGQIAVLLPHTNRDGASVVAESLIEQAAKARVFFRSEIHCYPDQESDRLLDFFDQHSRNDELSESPANGANNESNPAVATLERRHATLKYSRTRHTQPRSAVVVSRDLMQFMPIRYPAWKRTLDIVFAASGLIVTSPILFVAAVLIKATSRGPIFYSQMRTGWKGTHFRIHKLRSMVIDADRRKQHLLEMNERDGPAFKIAKDPRITPIGRILRCTGIDEIPQLWNVLRGEMAIVGPRPLPCEEDAQCHLWQRRRLDTKPGLTCFWQVSKNRKIAFVDWMRMDIRYSDKRSLMVDICLIMRTVMAVILGRVGH